MLELATGLQQGDPNNQVKQVRFDFGEFPPGKLDYMSVIEFFLHTSSQKKRVTELTVWAFVIFLIQYITLS